MSGVGGVDVEAELVAWLKGQRDERIVTDLPPNLFDVAPVVQISRVGGDDDGIRLDRAFVDVDVYDTTRPLASQLMAQVRTLILTSLRGTVTDVAVFTSARTITAPAWRPYENPSVRRFGTTFEIFCHPVS
ncbi:hypothetical protein ABZ725_14595 [Streptomyces sp. NPDC006872]|uniref:hypothetical protein n=1 Tax=Streptomyces sp. NPDC006872 TaxID=3155720 RepID=UPI0033E0D907